MTEPTKLGIIQVGEERWIPGSVRADGTMRKALRVRPGFVPHEDVERYSTPRSKPSTSNQKLQSDTAAEKQNSVDKLSVENQQEKKVDTRPIDKQIKAHKKSLRQIEELKDKLITKGEKLNVAQHEKIKKEKHFKDMLEKLEKLQLQDSESTAEIPPPTEKTNKDT